MPYIKITTEADLNIPVVGDTSICNTVVVPLYLKHDIYETVEKDANNAYLFYDKVSFSGNTKGENGAVSVEDTEVFTTESSTGDKIADPSFFMIEKLLENNIPVLVVYTTPDESSEGIRIKDNGVVLQDLLTKISNPSSGLYDFLYKESNAYDIKYITTGAWPTVDKNNLSAAGQINDICDHRQDSIGLISLPNSKSAVKDVCKENTIGMEKNNHCAAFWPNEQFEYSDSESSGLIRTYSLPGTYRFLVNHSMQLRNGYPDWYSTAGDSRGTINDPQLYTEIVGESLMHEMQNESLPINQQGEVSEVYTMSVNPIMLFSNAGESGSSKYMIYGNKCCVHGPVANSVSNYLELLNVNILACDINRQIKIAASKCMFEPNDDITWANFVNRCGTMLDKMKSSRGLEWYTWTRGAQTIPGVITANLLVKPIEAVDAFEIGVQLTNGQQTQ